MNTAFRLLGKRFEGGVPPVQTYGVNFPALSSSDHLSHTLLDYGIGSSGPYEITFEITPNAIASQSICGSSTEAFFATNSSGQITSRRGFGTDTLSITPLSIGVREVRRTSYNGSQILHYVNDVLDKTTNSPGARLQTSLLGARFPGDSLMLDGIIHSISIGTPTNPDEHVYLNTTGTGTTWDDVGSVGGVPMTLNGACSWVAN